ncbi:unnamed protein product [Effrenium voratum]|nr:unnamed protein product [Effrenium voratum]
MSPIHNWMLWLLALPLAAPAAADISSLPALSGDVSGWLSLSTSIQEKRLRIHNSCLSEPVWIAHMAGYGTGPDNQNIKIGPGEMFDFVTWTGLSSTRYWPKFRCDEWGNNCKIGESGGPGQTCKECAPPVDTKFEATFGDASLACDMSKGQSLGCDWVDVSLVDGFTAPFQLAIRGSCYNSSGHLMQDSQKHLDCSRLDMRHCPREEKVALPNAQGIPEVKTLDLRATRGEEAAGCYSPCSKLTLRQWGNVEALGRAPADEAMRPYCCPTPPTSPATCRAGPVKYSRYVEAIHSMCPGVYGFSYDDGMGLVTCEPTARYLFTIGCPKLAEPAAPAPAPAPKPSPAPKKLSPAPKEPSPAPKEPSPAPKASHLRKPSPETPQRLPTRPQADLKKECQVNGLAKCQDGTTCGNATTPCCPDGSLCPSSSDEHSKLCVHPKRLNCVRHQTKKFAAEEKEMCGVGDWVACDQSGAYFCAGDVCCPNGNTCPSGNQNTAPNCGKKTINCVTATLFK